RRLGGEADRCLRGRFPRPEPESRPRPDGGLPAIGARRRLPRQVPPQLREARAVRTRPGGEGPVHDAGHPAYVPARPSRDGAGATLLVPPRGPNPAAVCQYPHRPSGGFPKGDAAGLSRWRRGLVGDRAGAAVPSLAWIFPSAAALGNMRASEGAGRAQLPPGRPAQALLMDDVDRRTVTTTVTKQDNASPF